MNSKTRAIKITIISIHPEFLRAYTNFGPLKYAIQHGSMQLDILDLRDFASDKHRSVDDRVYGGGEGMLLSPIPIAKALECIRPFDRVVYTAPGARKWDRGCLEEFLQSIHSNPSGFELDKDSSQNHWVFLCGRFSGIDQRILEKYVSHQYSLGDFVLSGGELPVLTIIDSIARFLPGAVGNDQSVLQDSFENTYRGMIEFPQYTRPPVFDGMEVPPDLLSGNAKKIREWKQSQLRNNLD